MNPTHSNEPLLAVVLRFFFYCIILAAVALLMTWEAQHTAHTHLYHENSLLERMQVIALLATLSCAWCTGRLQPAWKGLTTLIIGASSLACIREFDAVLDHLFDGAWQLLATLTFILTLFLLRPHISSLQNTLKTFSKTASFGIMVSGFMTVFVFSRLIGRQAFWRAVMEDGYMRVVKRAVEESTELLGYTLIFIGAIELFRQSRPQNPQQKRP